MLKRVINSFLPGNWKLAMVKPSGTPIREARKIDMVETCRERNVMEKTSLSKDSIKMKAL
ncbi:MAG: hypothetical protein SV062_01910 [Thermodesulfobacteriota bacterium]|nr:hypothetical protein [Thermodesulfobacteriota bacterium]